ncbi:MAG: amidohydrolase [Gammaproteobacteria bacterium]|nr:amidohydrolase [Gammaproteobacteria bacterium]
MSLATAETIDVHAHAVLEETMGAAGAYGPELGHEAAPRFRVGNYELHGVRYRGSAFMDPVLRLRAMDVAGLDYQVLSPNPLTYFHFIEPRLAQAFCRIHNDALATVVKPHAERLGIFAAVPMQDIGFAIEETQRAVADLGMFGPYIGTDFGRPLNDPALDRFYAALTKLNVPLFIHPAPIGIDGPLGDPNLKQFDLDIIVGFAAQETIAVCTLIYGGVLERHPELDICLTHGGGATGYLFGRMASAAKKRPWSRDSLRQDGAFEELLHRLWFDIHVHSEDSLALLRERVNCSRLVFGTNFAGWDQQAGNIREEAKVYGDNARRLLRVTRQ